MYKETICIYRAVIISLSFGLFDEVYQSFVPGRYSSLFDMILNASGIFIAAVIYRLLLKKYLLSKI
jgi:VanZ family protein